MIEFIYFLSHSFPDDDTRRMDSETTCLARCFARSTPAKQKPVATAQCTATYYQPFNASWITTTLKASAHSM